MTQEKKELKVVFAPGCFDNFDGTQEELQELIAQLHQAAQDGSLLRDAEPLDLTENELDEMLKKSVRQ